MAEAAHDNNHVPSLLGVSNADGVTPVKVYADPVTHRLLVDSATVAGTVTSVSVVSANGFAGTVATATTTPAITLSTTITANVLKGNGTAISAASAGTDYVAPGAITTSGLTMSTAKMLGRATAATGAIEEIAVTGSGSAVLATSPTLVTPVLGVATATSINGLTITSSTGTLTITNLKTLSVSNTLTFTGTDGSSVAFGAGGTVLYTTSTIPLTVGTTTIASGTSTRILYDNAGVLGEYTVTGSGTTAVLSTSPTFTTSIISPLVQGGTGTTGTQLTLKTTSGAGTTDAMTFVGGNNGATTFLTLSANVANFGTSAVLTTGTIELGAATDTTIARVSAGVISVEGVTVPTISSTNTLTNKRVTRRLTTTNAPGATPTTNTDNVDIMNFTGLNTAITSMTTNLSGTPSDGDLLEFRFLDDGTARAITWGTSFASTTVTLPTTTVISTCLRVLCEWRAASSKWECLATA